MCKIIFRDVFLNVFMCKYVAGVALCFSWLLTVAKQYVFFVLKGIYSFSQIFRNPRAAMCSRGSRDSLDRPSPPYT